MVLANDSTFHTRTILLVPPSDVATADDIPVGDADPRDEDVSSNHRKVSNRLEYWVAGLLRSHQSCRSWIGLLGSYGDSL